MTRERIQRRLAAILAADVAGYSRMMGADEAGTRARLNEKLDAVIRPSIEIHHGRLVKTMGDGLLVEFASVLDAVQCAADIQSAIGLRESSEPEDRRMLFRIGLHLGDVIVEGNDIHGDGVNIAARLEGLAEPGGICVSDMVHAGVRNKLSLAFVDLGEQSLKNIADPVRVFRPILDAPRKAGATPSAAMVRHPTVAVLPFANLSGDPEQEYFADGLTEDIITALSLWRTFPVIARNSTFAYKAKSLDIRKVATELGARYLIEGSVRKAHDRLRVVAQLIDAETGHHLWAEKFDRNVEDIFAVQDEITTRVAATIQPALARAEQKSALTRGRENVDAWACFQRGMFLLQQFTKDSKVEARAQFARTLELDPSYARAYAGIAWCHAADLLGADTDAPEKSVTLMLENAQRAAALDDTDSMVQMVLCLCYPWAGELELSRLSGEKAVALNPSNALALTCLGNTLDLQGRSEEGFEKLVAGLTLNPQDPDVHKPMTFLARAYLSARRYEDAVDWARKAVQRHPDWPNSHYILAIALAHLDRPAEARAALAECERAQPGFVEKRRDWRPYRDQAANDHIVAGLEKAGWNG